MLPATLFDPNASEGSLVAFRPHDVTLVTDSTGGSITGVTEELGYNGNEYYCTVRVGSSTIEVPVGVTQPPSSRAVVHVKVDQSSLMVFAQKP